MITIPNPPGNKPAVLSEEIYVIKRSEPGLGYGEGERVRLIAGLHGNPQLGYHWTPGYVCVCGINEYVAKWVGHKIEDVVLDHTYFQLPKLLRAISPMRINDCYGQPILVGEDIYVVTEPGDMGLGYPVGTYVRFVALSRRPNEPGWHDNPDFVSVTDIHARNAQFVGCRKTALRLVSTGQ